MTGLPTDRKMLVSCLVFSCLLFNQVLCQGTRNGNNLASKVKFYYSTAYNRILQGKRLDIFTIVLQNIFLKNLFVKHILTLLTTLLWHNCNSLSKYSDLHGTTHCNLRPQFVNLMFCFHVKNQIQKLKQVFAFVQKLRNIL